ncbi:allophanate hydrolase [Zhongshania sp.]|uniref:allophanate hydrolase n=1 Tax=Zhongshania sp. TaxID=1971902 RepID=UPI003561D6D2
MDWQQLDLSLSGLRQHYRQHDFTPAQLCRHLLDTSQQYRHKNIWIRLLDELELAPYLAALENQSDEELPLYGVPFAIKDNIDLAGLPTTAACPEYAYTPDAHATVVQRLIVAGAIPLGKTNLDQFATGLVGTRSPYGACHNAYRDDYISGGSSSGSAVAVALGLVSFALGTDTAGSGRVPASFNNIVGLKPSCGALSTRGVLPACRSIDCVCIFALSGVDAELIFNQSVAFDALDDYAKPHSDSLWPGLADCKTMRIAIPHKEQLQFFGDGDAAALFYSVVARLARLGYDIIYKDFSAFFAAARLLYNGPWLAERYITVAEFMQAQPEAIHPVVKNIISPAAQMGAVMAFEGEYQMQGYRRLAQAFFTDTDIALMPTAGTIYRIADVLADPVALNSNLGHYTNFMNLLDLAAVAAPAGFLSSGLPWGVSFFGPSGSDRALLRVASKFNGESLAGPESQDWLALAVVGSDLNRQSLNHRFQALKAVFIEHTQTAAKYRLSTFSDISSSLVGLSRVNQTGAAIELELWTLPADSFGRFINGIPAPLGLGELELADGRWVNGIICETSRLEGSEDIRYSGR